LPVRDVADVMECSVSTVRSHISLARKTLREALAEKFPELALSEGRAQVSSDVDVGGLGGGR